MKVFDTMKYTFDFPPSHLKCKIYSFFGELSKKSHRLLLACALQFVDPCPREEGSSEAWLEGPGDQVGVRHKVV